jgi:hypothetical protein
LPDSYNVAVREECEGGENCGKEQEEIDKTEGVECEECEDGEK